MDTPPGPPGAGGGAGAGAGTGGADSPHSRPPPGKKHPRKSRLAPGHPGQTSQPVNRDKTEILIPTNLIAHLKKARRYTLRYLLSKCRYAFPPPVTVPDRTYLDPQHGEKVTIVAKNINLHTVQYKSRDTVSRDPTFQGSGSVKLLVRFQYVPVSVTVPTTEYRK